jgi:peptide deformylase
VSYQDASGVARTLTDDGLIARIVQHELDHLDGVLYIDHVPSWRRWLLWWRLRQLRRPRVTEGSA